MLSQEAYFPVSKIGVGTSPLYPFLFHVATGVLADLSFEKPQGHKGRGCMNPRTFLRTRPESRRMLFKGKAYALFPLMHKINISGLFINKWLYMSRVNR